MEYCLFNHYKDKATIFQCHVYPLGCPKIRASLGVVVENMLQVMKFVTWKEFDRQEVKTVRFFLVVCSLNGKEKKYSLSLNDQFAANNLQVVEQFSFFSPPSIF